MTDTAATFRAILLMMASTAGFVINDTCMKALSDELPFFQAVFLRSVLVTLVFGVVIWATPKARFTIPKGDRGVVFWRTLAEIGAAFFFITAIFNGPLAEMTAILQALPLTVTLAGALFLREAVGWRRMLAILVGFLGMLLIVRPGAEGFDIYAVYAVLAVICITARDVYVRKLSPGSNSLTIAGIGALGLMLFTGLGSLTVTWAMPSPLAVAQLLGAVVAVFVALLSGVAAMRAGNIAVVSVFRYSSLLWALILGYLVFEEWPDMLTLIGAGIVVSTGLFTLYRERKAMQRDT